MNSESKSSTLGFDSSARRTYNVERSALAFICNWQFSLGDATRLAFERALIVIRLVRLDTNQPHWHPARCAFWVFNFYRMCNGFGLVHDWLPLPRRRECNRSLSRRRLAEPLPV